MAKAVVPRSDEVTRDRAKGFESFPDEGDVLASSDDRIRLRKFMRAA